MTENGQKLAQLIAVLADDKKGQNILTLDLQGISLVADYFVIVSANNEPQVQAIVRAIKEGLEKEDVKLNRLEGEKEARWVLMDYGEVVVHVFHKETRDYYRLEKLWADAPQLQFLI